MMTKKLFPFIVLILFILSSCGSDPELTEMEEVEEMEEVSDNSDINKEWVLIDLNYSMEATLEGKTVMFDGQLTDGDATIQFDEEANVVKSKGMYTVQLESKEDMVRVGRQEVTFDQFGSWMRDGDIISISGDYSFGTDLIIASLTESKMELDFEYTQTLDLFGSLLNSTIKGSYVFVTPEYINAWKEKIKGGWILTDIDMVQYDRSFGQTEGAIDKKSVGVYSEGDAPLEFGGGDGFLASGGYKADIESTKYESSGLGMTSTSTKFYSFFEDGSYSIDGRECTVKSNEGETRTLYIIDATEEKLTFFESMEQGDNRSGIKYTMVRQDYIAIPAGTILGTWKLSDYYSEDHEDISIGGGAANRTSIIDELISTTSEMVISLDPNTITKSGSHEVKITTAFGDFEEIEEKTRSLFSSDNWIQSGNEFQVLGLGSSSKIYTIEYLSQTEMILFQDLENTYFSSGYKFEVTGFKRYTFVR